MPAKHLLIVSPVPTHPSLAGNSACILAYSQLLKSMGYRVSFLWVVAVKTPKAHLQKMHAYWGNQLYIYKKRNVHRILEGVITRCLFNPTGYHNLDAFYPWGIGKYIHKVVHPAKFQCLIVNYVFLSRVFKYFPKQNKILYTHDVFTNKYQRTGQPWFSIRSQQESKALNRADTILAIQRQEASFYHYLTSRHVHTSYSYFPVNASPFRGNHHLLYLAGPNIHNVESIKWFIRKVFDPLSRNIEDLKLIIGGRICEALIGQYYPANIQLLGEIKNPAEFYGLGDIAVNPTYNGTGLKIKSFEALAHGKVVVSHKHSVEGIFRESSSPILVANDEHEFQHLIAQLLSDVRKTKALKKKSIGYIKLLNTEVEKVFTEAIENNSEDLEDE